MEDSKPPPTPALRQARVWCILGRLVPVFFCLCMAGCSPAFSPPAELDALTPRDEALPEQALLWLSCGEQSRVTDDIKKIAEGIKGETRRERLRGAMAYIWGNFSYDPWLKTEAFKRTAGELYKTRMLCGCSDFALVQVALFRALGIPSRMIITCNVDWIHIYRREPVTLSEGHGFVEVYLEDDWYLVDSTYRWLFSSYDPDSSFYPHGEVFVGRGRDFWDMEIRTMDDLDRLLKAKAASYDGGFCEPSYPKHPL